MIYQLHWKLKLLQTWTEFFASNTFVFPSRYELKLQSLDWISEIWNYFTPISSIIYYSLYKNGTWRLGRIYTTLMGFLMAKKFFPELVCAYIHQGHPWLVWRCAYHYGKYDTVHVWAFPWGKPFPEMMWAYIHGTSISRMGFCHGEDFPRAGVWEMTWNLM